MGPTWDPPGADPGVPHVSPIKIAIWVFASLEHIWTHLEHHGLKLYWNMSKCCKIAWNVLNNVLIWRKYLERRFLHMFCLCHCECYLIPLIVLLLHKTLRLFINSRKRYNTQHMRSDFQDKVCLSRGYIIHLPLSFPGYYFGWLSNGAPVKCQMRTLCINIHIWIYQNHKSYNAPVPHPTMHHSEEQCAHFCSQCWIMGYGTGALWDFWGWPEVIYLDCRISKHVITRYIRGIKCM